MNDLDEWLAKAHTLAEALPYMRAYAETTFVIKYGGHAMGDDELAVKFARDIVLIKQVASTRSWCMAAARRSAACWTG